MHTRRLVTRRFAAALAAAATCFAAASAALGFDLQAHRGGRGLLPENTLAAFENALALGVTTLEMDVAITADGVAVISHDPALSPALTRDASGAWIGGRAGPLIKTLPLADVQRYDVGRLNTEHPYAKPFAATQQPRDGQRIPTLAAVFALVKSLGADRVHFDIETKVFPDRPEATVAPEDFVRIMLGVIREAGMVDRVMIQSFDWRTLALFQAAEPRIRTMYLTIKTRNVDNAASPAWTAGRLVRDYPSVAHMIKAAGGHIWAPNFPSLDEGAVRAAQALGLQVIPWTVNEPADMRRLIRWKVDGIISDYPDRLREVMGEFGMALPAAVKR